MKQVLLNAASGSKIFYLFLFSFLGFFVTVFLLELAASFFFLSRDNVNFIYFSTFLQSVFMFLLPAYCVAKWGFGDALVYLEMKTPKAFGKKIGFAVLVFVVSSVFVSFLTQWNKELQLPESMSGIERWMREMENSALKTTDMLLSSKSVYKLFMNLLIIALLAAVSEELFFRGILQQLLKDVVKNAHIAVWLSAFIFSAIHMQFYGFLPRWILGVLLGYLFLYTRSLWTPIIFHFINNAIVVVVFYFGKEKAWTDRIEDIPFSPFLIILATASAVGTFLLFRKYKRTQALNN